MLAEPAHLRQLYGTAAQSILITLRQCRISLRVSDAPVHTVVETKAFTSRAKALGLSAEELAAIYDVYASQPDYGKVVRRTGGLRKGRIAKDHTGKSGGYRVFSFYADRDNPIFLLWLLDKTGEDTLTDEQEQAFKKLTTALKKELRK